MTVGFYSGLEPVFADPSSWTLSHVLEARSASHADKEFLRIEGGTEAYTYREAYERSKSIAHGLRRTGAKPGDHMLIMAPNSADFIFAWFGAHLAGLAEAPINIEYRGRFLTHQLDVLQPRFAVVHVDQIAAFIDLAAEAEKIERFFLLGPDHAVAAAVNKCRECGLSAAPFRDLYTPSLGSEDLTTRVPHDTAGIFFTSGTTGLSKGVVMTSAHCHFFAEEAISLTQLTEHDIYYTPLPLFHANAQFITVLPAMIAGATVVLARKFSASGWVRSMHETGATVTNLLGVMMDFIWNQPPSELDRNNHLRRVLAAPVATSIADQFKNRFGIDAFLEVFGSTEIAMPIMTPYGVERPAGSFGLAVRDWFDVRLLDPETDEEVAIGEIGELAIRPRLPWIITQGYLGMPERTLECFRNLWFHTGDGLRQDKDGWFFFVDRLKDAIRRRGENISSFEIEQTVLGMPGILECAALAVPSEIDGGEDEVLLAVVTDDRPIDADSVWKWCDANLPKFAVPRYLRFLTELPKTPTSKVEKSTLRSAGTHAPGVLERLPSR